MGVYIKGLTKENWENLTIEEIEDGFEIVEIKAPHGRLIDIDTIPFYQYGINRWCGYTNELVVTEEDVKNIPAVIEEEV